MVGKRQAWVPTHGDHLTIERSSSLAGAGTGAAAGEASWEITGTSADVDQLLRQNNAPLGGVGKQKVLMMLKIKRLQLIIHCL